MRGEKDAREWEKEGMLAGQEPLMIRVWFFSALSDSFVWEASRGGHPWGWTEWKKGARGWLGPRSD